MIYIIVPFKPRRKDKMMSGTSLKRGLTSSQVSMIGLSGALGTGLFLGSGSVIAFAGPSTIISYTFAGLLALAVVWALAEMVTVHPVAGGYGAVSSSYVGRLAGYVARWNFTVTFAVAMGAEVTATATYIRWWFPSVPLWAGTLGCALFIVALNISSVHLYGSSEYWFSMIKVVAIISFILLTLALILGMVPGHQASGLHHLTAHGGFAPYGMTGILAATCIAVFSFGGVENVSVTAAESADPRHDIPRAAGNMIYRLIVFYLLAVGVVLTLQPWNETAAGSGALEESPFVTALALTGVSSGAHIMNAVLIVAALSAANGLLYSSSRMLHSLAIDGEAPSMLARTSANGSPRYAVLSAALGMGIAAILALISPDRAFLYLSGVATVGILITWVLTMVTHMKFRSARKAADAWLPKHRLWGAPVVNALVIAASVAIFIALFWLMPVAWYAGIPYMVVLFASYALVSRGQLSATPDLLADELTHPHDNAQSA
ncbi:amino acid permease [Arcanobacterium canis]|uniref:Amino acid permease n=1 Tax=Arcanobacterium canis TaxID=999183 RepID=A0ABY8FZH0_9ACTO|nr:amino acid permease [Arcanobacterium canis]WFM82965.1 amino acid permease [Arcanobacterium canis]